MQQPTWRDSRALRKRSGTQQPVLALRAPRDNNDAMHAALLVAAGGAIGSVFRYFAGLAVQRLSSGELPMGTFVVNVVGCFLIGAFAAAAETRPALAAETRLFFVVGVLGGFTTFSSFGYEAFELLRRGQAQLALLHVAGQCLLGIGAVAIAYQLLRTRAG